VWAWVARIHDQLHLDHDRRVLEYYYEDDKNILYMGDV
jgi:hypothetical protein